MKQAVLIALLLSAGAAHAELLPRDLTKDGIADAYYDTVLNISWLADASPGAGSVYDDGNQTGDGRFTWNGATAYVSSLDIGGVTGWRLPTALASCLGYCTVTTPDDGNELGYHRAINLGGPYYDFLWLHHNSNYDLFANITQSFYWTGTHAPHDPTSDEQYAVAYQIDDGYTGWEPDRLDLYVWPVHDGDVGDTTTPVPEPSSAWLLLAGALFAIVRTWRGSAWLPASAMRA